MLCGNVSRRNTRRASTYSAASAGMLRPKINLFMLPLAVACVTVNLMICGKASGIEPPKTGCTGSRFLLAFSSSDWVA